MDPKIHPHGRPSYISSNVDFIQGYVTDRATLLAALQGVDIVSHQAAYQDYMPDFSRFVHVNAAGTALLYELCGVGAEERAADHLRRWTADQRLRARL
ncbi:MAG: hypothetical protein LAP86_08015 [Acidobacteriia bacterium]|nr:hypothetical protein [Terriglobia bacterium]